MSSKLLEEVNNYDITNDPENYLDYIDPRIISNIGNVSKADYYSLLYNCNTCENQSETDLIKNYNFIPYTIAKIADTGSQKEIEEYINNPDRTPEELLSIRGELLKKKYNDSYNEIGNNSDNDGGNSVDRYPYIKVSLDKLVSQDPMLTRDYTKVDPETKELTYRYGPQKISNKFWQCSSNKESSDSSTGLLDYISPTSCKVKLEREEVKMAKQETSFKPSDYLAFIALVIIALCVFN